MVAIALPTHFFSGKRQRYGWAYHTFGKHPQHDCMHCLCGHHCRSDSYRYCGEHCSHNSASTHPNLGEH